MGVLRERLERLLRESVDPPEVKVNKPERLCNEVRAVPEHVWSRECLPGGDAHVGGGLEGSVRLILSFATTTGSKRVEGAEWLLGQGQGDAPSGTISSKIGRAERNHFTN